MSSCSILSRLLGPGIWLSAPDMVIGLTMFGKVTTTPVVTGIGIFFENKIDKKVYKAQPLNDSLSEGALVYLINHISPLN